MTIYAKVDDLFFTNPKARRAGLEGRALYFAGLCHCSAHLTDGHVLADMVSILAAEAGVSPSVADQLVLVNLWHSSEHGCPDCPAVPTGDFVVHDYLKSNKSRAQVDAERERDRNRKRSAGNPGGSPAGTPPAIPPPVQSSPTDDSLLSSSVLPVGKRGEFSTGDDEIYPGVNAERLWNRYAKLKTDKVEKAGGIKTSRSGYETKTRDNLPEPGQVERVREVMDKFDLSDHQDLEATLAEVLVGNLETRSLRVRRVAS